MAQGRRLADSPERPASKRHCGPARQASLPAAQVPGDVAAAAAQQYTMQQELLRSHSMSEPDALQELSPRGPQAQV